MIEIKLANLSEIKEILKIYSHARNFMKNNGNPNQWGNNKPTKNDILKDIENNNLYVIYDNNIIVGVFAFIIGADKTYLIIKNGTWNNNIQYGTIHRIASNGKRKGITKICFEYCLSKINYLRIDTHKDNIIMQKAITNFGFKECGIIFKEDKSERIAYDYFKDIC